ncbi:MAG: PP2C family serine/threonine-protein phosphatase [Lachnospiraceae bacterium]|nr:PP2C family serine/threonine-protein phosphatase [Lachnospiraceae bacterium]
MNDNIFAFSATETGYNHIRINKVCEDASDFYDDEKMHICVVADGHGSDNYPRTEFGSKFAVDAAIKNVIEFVNTAEKSQVINDAENHFERMNQLAKSILRSWYESVEEDYNKKPFTEKELEKVSDKYKNRYLSENIEERKVEKAYGCTLIIYVITDDYSFGMQIGDGKCVLIDENGQFLEPIPWDDDCQLNVTTSICDDDAIDEFRFYISDKMPTAVFIGSDGIDDSYANEEELYALYRSILKIFIEHGDEVGKSEIREYLPVLTKRGSGDDVSMGLIINQKRAKSISSVFEMQIEVFKLTEELQDKKHKKDIVTEKALRLSSRIKKWKDIVDMPSEEQREEVVQVNDLIEEERNLSIQIQEIEKKLVNLSENQKNINFVDEADIHKSNKQQEEA